jgi:hypothetical protein
MMFFPVALGLFALSIIAAFALLERNERRRG